MALSVTPPSQNNGDENRKPELPSLNGGLPVQPPRSGGLSVTPPKAAPLLPPTLKGRDLDEEMNVKRVEEGKPREFVYTEAAANRDSYENVNSLSAEDVISKDYTTYYARLEPKVTEVKEWLQQVLSDQNRNQDIGEARKDRRSPKYKEIRTLLDQLLVRHFSQEMVVNPKDAATVSALVINELIGLGPIEPLWQDSRITEIMVNGPKRVRIEINGRLIDAKGVQFRDQEHLLDTCQQILAPLNKTIDIAHPYADGRLNDGSRINVTHPAIGPGGPYLTIRRFPETVFSMKRLVDTGSMTEEIATTVGNLIYAGCSTVVAGGTGSGKTSMLNALSGCIPDTERVITIEDNLELRLHPKRDVVALEARKSNQEGGTGNVTIRDLVRNALRMRPDRIVVGEVRDSSAYDMLQAMNTGHEGSMTTVHANDAEGSIDRLINLIAESQELEAQQAFSLIANGVDLIVAIRRFEDGSRRVESISEIPSRVTIEGTSPTLKPITLWEFRQTGLTPDEKIIGEYVKVNDISEALVKKHRLDRRTQLTLEEIYELSEQDPNAVEAS